MSLRNCRDVACNVLIDWELQKKSGLIDSNYFEKDVAVLRLYFDALQYIM